MSLLGPTQPRQNVWTNWIIRPELSQNARAGTDRDAVDE